MKCFCCGKEVAEGAEQSNGWHQRCIKKFFGTNKLPELSLDKNVLEDLANKAVNKGLTIPGVQKKLSLYLEKSRNEARLTLVNYPTGYILKPQSAEYPLLPEAEHLAMSMAKITGISVVPFSMIKYEGEMAYITKRIDRINDCKYAMEDFCQLSGRSTADKYKSSYEECGKIVKKYSGRIGVDMTELFLRLIFCNVVGNSDMHLKNFSLIETQPKNRQYVLAPAYDLLSVNIVMPSDKDFMALTLNGKKRNLRKKDFLELAANMGINDKVARNIIESVLNKKEVYESLINESFVSDDFKAELISLMNKRMDLLEP